jgi:hypothetical protein
LYMYLPPQPSKDAALPALHKSTLDGYG